MEARLVNSSIAPGDTYGQTSLYCAFSKEKSAACDAFKLGNYNGNGIFYQRDGYWNKSATLPADVSVLLLNGKLDPQTPHKYAQYMLEALRTSKKELVTFDYAEHDIVATPRLGDSNDPDVTCGMKLLVSYISNNGDLQRLDKSCVGQMPAFNLTVPTNELHNFFSTDEAYDGAFQSGLSST